MRFPSPRGMTRLVADSNRTLRPQHCRSLVTGVLPLRRAFEGLRTAVRWREGDIPTVIARKGSMSFVSCGLVLLAVESQTLSDA